MRIYFISSRTAGLKLDGIYVGIIDGFERFFDMDEDADVLAEVIPDGNAEPLNFFINGDFFKNPPDFADVYLTDGDAIISLNRYKQKEDGIKVIAQKRFAGGLATLILNGGTPCLIVEGKTTESWELSREFANASLTESAIGGHPVLLVEGEKCLTVISETGKRVFYNPCESREVGQRLEIRLTFNTCAGCRAHCAFAYDGNEMKLVESRTEETKKPAPETLHFAFFESVLTRADCAKYLCEELKPRANDLTSFLGEFVDVNIPPEKFYDDHPDICAPEKYAAGLTYPLARNLFEIKYFAVEMQDGLIANIYEVED